MISKSIAERVLAEALTTGGDFAELFMEDTRQMGIMLMDGMIDSASTSRRHGAGIRVYKKLESVYVHTFDTSEAGLMRVARQAADAIGDGHEARDVRLTGAVCTNIHRIEQLPVDVDGGRKAKLLHDAYKAAKDYSPDIKQVVSRLIGWETDAVIANSEGLFTGDKRVYTRLAVQAVASNGTENQTGFEGPGAMRGFELFERKIDATERAKIAANTALTMLHAPNCPAGVMPVVMAGGFGGVVFHEACGHSLEATSVARGQSEFCGKLGQQIASPIVTAIDDGTIPFSWGSTNIDDEGAPTTKLVLIENGILKNYMIDKLGGLRMGMPSTGSGRRQDYTFAPTSRMRNTYIAAGNDDDAEMIATMGDGLYAAKMGGGSVNPATGEFNFSVSEGYLVKDGKIAHPVRGASLIGRGGEVLMKIDRVGKDCSRAQGVCGSLSGSVPTDVGQPHIRISSMTVGGRDA